nr:hypothetical protein [Tanacetum cinerariifolium]GEW87798.1 hypothetical protein [Tanacetum cinerariifolium]
GRTVSLDPPVIAASGDSSDSIDKLFDEGNDVGQEHSVEKDDDVLEETVTKGASEVVAEKTKKKYKRKVVGDARGHTFPPKKLREDYHAGASGTGGKSLATIRELVPDGSSVSSEVTGPPTVVSVPPTPDDGPTDSMSGPNLWTCPPFLRCIISLDDYHRLSSYSEFKSFARSPAKDAPVTTVSVTTTVTADASIVPPPRVRVMSKNLEIVADSTSAGEVNAYAAGTLKLNEPVDSSYSFYASQDLDSDTLHYRDAKIVHLKSLLSLKEAEVAKAICLRGQLTVVEAADAAKGGELRDLKGKNFAFEEERDVMSEKIATFESTNATKEVKLASFSFQVANLTSNLFGFQLSFDELDSKVASLESERDCLVTQSSEYLQALGKAIGCVVNKGIQDGLKAGIDHGQVGRDLSVIEAYDPFAEAKYIDAVNALGAVDFSLLSELESKKDTCIVDLMNSLCMEDDVVIRETTLSSSLQVVHLRVQRFRGEVKQKRLLLMDVITPLVEPLSSKSLTGEASTSDAPITTLSTTFDSFNIVLPTSVVTDQVLDVEPHNEDPSAMTFGKEELGTSSK